MGPTVKEERESSGKREEGACRCTGIPIPVHPCLSYHVSCYGSIFYYGKYQRGKTFCLISCLPSCRPA